MRNYPTMTTYPIASGNKNPTPHNFKLEHFKNRVEAISYTTVVAILPMNSDTWIYANTYSATTTRQIGALYPRAEYMQTSFDRILDKLRRDEETV